MRFKESMQASIQRWSERMISSDPHARLKTGPERSHGTNRNEPCQRSTLGYTPIPKARCLRHKGQVIGGWARLVTRALHCFPLPLTLVILVYRLCIPVNTSIRVSDTFRLELDRQSPRNVCGQPSQSRSTPHPWNARNFKLHFISRFASHEHECHWFVPTRHYIGIFISLRGNLIPKTR